MSKPQRIQLRRTKGWRKPEGAIVVARPSKWGNPWRHHTPEWRDWAAKMFDSELTRALLYPWAESTDIHVRIIAESLDELRGHDLACWCPLDQPCHADVLLRLANPAPPPWRPFDGSEPDVDPDTGDERATSDAEGRAT